MSDMKWYVVHTYSGMEKSAESALRERIAREGLQDCFEEILVPTEDISEVKNGKKRVSTRRMYSGYIFVKMIMNDETWHLVKTKMDAGSEAPRPRVEFEVGGSVRIKNGPFTDFNGIIEEVNYDKNRLRVMVSIFGRDTPVELAFNEVEKA